MKGIILAGGTGSRLSPLTRSTNKHLLPIGDKMMIQYPIERLAEAGITEILIVTGTEHMGAMVQALGSGKDFDCNFTYKVQDEAGGIAQALSLAENFTGNSKICVILGDNIFNYNLSKDVEEMKKTSNGAKLFLTTHLEPERFGVARIEYNKIVEIIEKPKNPPTNKIITGVYMYDNSVFDIIRTIKPSDRGELEITDVNNHYIKNNNLTYTFMKGDWTDAGTHKSYQIANRIIINYWNKNK